MPPWKRPKTTRPMNDTRKRLLAGMFKQMADQEIDPRHKLGDLEQARKLDPLDQEIAATAMRLQATLSTGLTYVAIDEATILGPDDRPLEGQIFVRREDGSLTPITGPELIQFSEAHRDFAKRWRLPEE